MQPATTWKEKIKYNAIYIVLFSIFLIVTIVQGPREYPDSGAYINMTANVAPLYPLTVAGFRLIFRERLVYETALAVFQCLLLTLGIRILTENIGRSFHVQKFRLLNAAILAVPIFMTSFVAVSGLYIPASILTEGLSIPLWYFFFAELISFVFEKSKKANLCCWIFIILLTLTRGQFEADMLLLCIVEIIVYRTQIKLILPAIGKTIGAFLLVALFTRGYMYAVHGVFAEKINETVTATANIYFVSTNSDVDAVPEQYRDLYSEISRRLDEKKYRKEFFSSDIFNCTAGIEKCHDLIKSEVTMPILNEYLENNGGMDAYARDRILGEIAKPILKAHFGQWFYGYICLCLLGLVRSVAASGRIFYFYAAVIYLSAIVLTIHLLRKKNGGGFGFYASGTLLHTDNCVVRQHIHYASFALYDLQPAPFLYCGTAGTEGTKKGRKVRDF